MLVSLFIFGAFGGMFLLRIWYKRKIAKIFGMMQQYIDYYHMFNQWLYLKNNDTLLEKYFTDRGFSSVAICGMNDIGCRLYEELKKSSLSIAYCIDEEDNNIFPELDSKSMSDTLPKVDVIVVTDVVEFDNIEENLASQNDYKIISLDELFYEI